MAQTLDELMSELGVVGYWNVSTGAALDLDSVTLGNLTKTNVVADTTLFEMSQAAGDASGTFNGTDALLISDTTLGSALIDKINGEGLMLHIAFRATGAFASKVLLSCMDNTGSTNGFEIAFGKSAAWGSSGNDQNLGVILWRAGANRVALFPLTGDAVAGGSPTVSHYTDGHVRHLWIWIRRRVAATGGLMMRAWLDGREIAGTDPWANHATPFAAIDGSTCRLRVGCTVASGTNTGFLAASMQALAVFPEGILDRARMIDIMKAAQITPGEIPGAVELDMDTAFCYTDAGATVEALPDEQVRVVKSVDSRIIFTATVAAGGITAATAANPTALTSNGHGLITGQMIEITGSNTTPSIDGIHQMTKTGANTFTIPVNVTGAGDAGTWTVHHGPYLRVDEAGHRYLDFVNRFQRRGWLDPMGNMQHWLTATGLSCYAAYSGLYVVGCPNISRLHTQDQIIAAWQTAGESTQFALTLDGQTPDMRPCVILDQGVATRTPTNADMKVPSCAPGISFMGMSLGYFGLSSQSGSGAVYCDGQISALSGTLFLNNAGGAGFPEYALCTSLRIGARDTSILGDDGASVHPTTNGLDGRLYKLAVQFTRPITDIEFRRSEVADRKRLGLPETFDGLAVVTGDSTWSGEQDIKRGGVVARTTGLRSWKVLVLAYPGDTAVSIATHYDLTSAKFKHDLPVLWLYGMGINDAATALTAAEQENACLALAANVRNLGGGQLYAIVGLTPQSPGVSANTAFDAWTAGSNSPFDAHYQRPSVDDSTGTSYEAAGKHPNAAGCQLEADAMTAPVALGVATLAPAVAVDSSGRMSRFSR